MGRALVRKAGLLVLAVGCIVIGIAIWVVPERWFDSGDRLAGAGLIACGVVFAAFSLLLRTARAADGNAGADSTSDPS